MVDPLPMAQVPNFQLGAVPNNAPSVANAIASVQGGGAQAIQAAQFQQQLAFQQQQAKIQNGLKIIDPLLNQMNTYPDLTKYYWPTFANAMNNLSPDYKLDPQNPPPPEAMKPLTKQLGMVMQGVTEGSISMDQGHMMTKGIINENMPKPAPMSPEQSVQAGMDFIAQSPLKMQPDMMNYMKMTPQYQTMQSNLEEQRQLAQSAFTQHQESARSLMTSFENQSQDAKNVFDNLNVFNSQMGISRQFAGAKDTTGAVNAEKASLLAFAQMAYPGTGRPGNMEMLENMEKSGPYGTLIAQALNKLDKGEIMTESQIKGLRQAAVGIATAREKSQTDQENTTSSAMSQHGVNPSSMIRNYRPSSIVSTSKLFPNKGTGKPLIGQVYKGHQFLGGDPADQDNWVKAPHE